VISTLILWAMPADERKGTAFQLIGGHSPKNWPAQPRESPDSSWSRTSEPRQSLAVGGSIGTYQNFKQALCRTTK